MGIFERMTLLAQEVDRALGARSRTSRRVRIEAVQVPSRVKMPSVSLEVFSSTVLASAAWRGLRFALEAPHDLA